MRAARKRSVVYMHAGPDVKYLPRHCPFLKKEVWAILTKHPNGTWHVANCLDKHAPCARHRCAFTVDGGEWPFEPVTEGSVAGVGRRPHA